MTTVAIIEDNDTMRKTFVELINNTPGFGCVCACSTSREALMEVPKHCPHVALMDIHLPDESGIACTPRLTEKMPDLHAIMMTVYANTDLILQAPKAGACGYILKRSRPEEIIQAISDVHQRRPHTEGLSNKEIGRKVDIAAGMVRNHLANQEASRSMPD